MDLRSQCREEGDDPVGGTEAEGGARGDDRALLACGLGLVAARVVAPGPHPQAHGQRTDHGDDPEEIDAGDDLLQDGQAGQAAALRRDVRVVGEIADGI
ncbi:hypothetical protein DUI70_6939 [Streptomyces albus]|nr:hypothetical protein DUI70_6939 [Streptomyces albus]